MGRPGARTHLPRTGGAETVSGPKTRQFLDREAEVIATGFKHRALPFVLGRAHGARVWDIDGREYIDWHGAAATAVVGYGNPALRNAVVESLDSEWFQVLAVSCSAPAVILAEQLVTLIPGEFDKRVWFGASGSDALDFLVKTIPLAAGRRTLVSFAGAHHGMTIGSGVISGDQIQAHFPGAGHVVKAPYPNPYRCPWGPCDKSECPLHCLRFLEQEVLGVLCSAEETAAIFVEPIQSFSGDIVPPDNYLPALRALCDRYGIWLIVDEVKTGIGRTGRMFAFEHADVIPDAVALGKPLGGGLALSAVVGRRSVVDVSPITAQSQGGAPVACTAALAVLEIVREEQLAERAANLGAQVMTQLQALQARYPVIGDVRGRGLLIGVELVTDRRTREPASEAAARLVRGALERGLLVTSTGRYQNVIEITPPLTIDAEELDSGLRVFEQALQATDV